MHIVQALFDDPGRLTCCDGPGVAVHGKHLATRLTMGPAKRSMVVCIERRCLGRACLSTTTDQDVKCHVGRGKFEL